MTNDELVEALERSILAHEVFKDLLKLHKPAKSEIEGDVYCHHCAIPYRYPCTTVRFIARYFKGVE